MLLRCCSWWEKASLERHVVKTVRKRPSHPGSLRAMKATVRRCLSASFDAYHDDLLKLATDVRRSNDAKEGVRAFLEKRKPNWRAN